MKKIFIIPSVLFFITNYSFCQDINCDFYKNKDNKYYNACLIYTRACDIKQGAKEAQLMLDSALAICPHFAPAYYVKAIPYLKRGEFIEWKKLIDKAVEYDTLGYGYLGYRGGCLFSFLRDYQGAINDIEKLLSISKTPIGTTYNGDYNLNIILALSYKGLGDTLKAIKIIEDYMATENYSAEPYDYFHLGVLKLENSDYNGAIEALNKQIGINDFVAETYYYLAKVWEKKGDKTKYIYNLEKSKTYYMQGKVLPGPDSFMDYMDKIYLPQIEKEIETAKK